MFTRWSDLDRGFTLMDELRRRMDRAFDDVGAGQSPSMEGNGPRMNFFDTGAGLVLQADLPGVEDKDLELTLDQDVLTVKAQRKVAPREGYSVHRREREAFQFVRSVTLPCRVDADKVNAELRDGVLTVTLTKAREAQPRQIAVKTP